MAQQFGQESEVLKICAALDLKEVEMIVRVHAEIPYLRVPIPNP